MSDSILRTKAKDFAKDIVLLCRKLKQNNVEGALINQLLRCGTSIGANVHEAQYAQGTKDFISKFEICCVISYLQKIIILTTFRRKLKTNPVTDAFTKMCLGKLLHHSVPQSPSI